MLEPGYEDHTEFLAEEVEIIASMPCYSAENVNAQRGEGVFDGSIEALQLLNSLGYGIDPALPFHLVYNPNGAFLPPPQNELEADYKRELKKHFGIVFNRLYAITNLPIGRFAAYLRHNNQLAQYMELLIEAFNPATIEGLMCRNTISVGWRGEVYDCDFNQQLEMQWSNGQPIFLWDIDPESVENREIMTGDHCFGCTAGAGSSCGGAIVKVPSLSPDSLCETCAFRQLGDGLQSLCSRRVAASEAARELFKRKFDSFFFFTRDELISLNDARAGVPTQDRIVVTGRPERFGFFEPVHCFLEKIVRLEATPRRVLSQFIFARRSATIPE